MKFSSSGIHTKAAVLVKTNQPLELIRDIEVPLPGKGQALIKIHYAGLCHSQLMEIEGQRGEDKYLPHMLGHEGMGEVIKIGEGVSKIKPGDQVVLGWIKGAGIEGGGCQYRSSDGTYINAGSVATFSEYVVVSENRLVIKPSNTPDELSVLYGCAVPTGLGMVLNSVSDTESKSIAFLGLGGIGLSALLSIKLHQFKNIFAIDVNEDKLELAKRFGVHHVINPRKENLLESVMKATTGVGVDYCFESAGRVETIEQGFSIVRRGGGKCVFASHPSAGQKISIDPFELICGKKIEGTWGGGVFPDLDVEKFDNYYKKGCFPLNELISKKYKLEDINVAVSDLKNQKIARALIQCAEDVVL